MASMNWRQIASGIALVIAAVFVVLLHIMRYSQEHQLYGVALAGVFGFLSISSNEVQQDETWWW
jgi:hypothetical protein